VVQTPAVAEAAGPIAAAAVVVDPIVAGERPIVDLVGGLVGIGSVEDIVAEDTGHPSIATDPGVDSLAVAVGPGGLAGVKGASQ
jgi:hypothetical protein